MHTLKKVGKVFLYIILGLIILLFVVGLFIDPIAKKVMISQVDKAAEGQFSLALDEVDISILGGDFSLKGVVLETDTTHPETPPLAFLKANEISVEGVSWLTFLLDDRLLMDRVLLDQLNVELFARTVDTTQQKEEDPKPFRLQDLDVYPMIKDQVDRFRLKDMTLNDISLTLINLSTQDTLRFNSKELNFQSDDILIDADKLITDQRAFYATEMDFLGRGVRIERTGNKSLIAQTDYIKFETREDKIGLLTQGVNFLQSGTMESDTLMSVTLDEFLLSDLGMQRIQEDSTAHIEKIGLTGLEVVNNIPASPDTAMVPDTVSQPKLNLAEMSLGKSLPEFLTKIELEELELSEIFYQQGPKVRLKDANIDAAAIVIDKSPAFSQNRFLHASNMESSFDLFALSMGDDSVNILLTDFRMEMEDGVGSIGFQDMKMKPGERSKDVMWVDAELGPLSIVGINTRQIPEKTLLIDSIGLASPKLVLNMPEEGSNKNSNINNTYNKENNNNNSNTNEIPALDLYPAIEGVLETFHLRKFALIDADIRASGLMEGSTKEVHIPTIYLQVTDFKIAEGTAFSGDRVLHSDDIALRVEEINLPMDELYTLNLDVFRLSTRERFVEAKNFSYDYSGKRGEIPSQADTNFIMSVQNDRFLINQLNWQGLLKEQRVVAGLVRSEGLELYFFTNHNKSTPNEEVSDSIPTEQEVQPMPQKVIRQIETPFYVGKFELEDANFTFEEMVEGAEKAGLAKITDIYVAASNITNLPAQLRKNPKLPIAIEGKLMGTGDFNTQIIMDMVSESHQVRIRGQIDTLDITKMNRYTEYTTRLGFESGEIYQVGWDIKANEELATGTLEMSYDNLKIQISESNNPNTSGILKNVGSFLANKLVLESDVAPASSEEPEEAEFTEERDGESFPTYVLQGLISGFMELMVTIF